MNRLAIIAPVAAAAILALPAPAAQIDGSGRAVTEERAARDVYGVAVSVPAEVEVTQGSAEGVRITADDNLLPYIETIVENGILRIRPRDQSSLSARSPIRVSVTARAPQVLAVAGSARLHAPSLALGRVEAKISGSGRIELAGATPSFTAHVSGSGDIDAARLHAQDVRASISGSGNVRVSAQGTLSATIAGSGDIRYYGQPKVDQRVAGSGRVQRLGDQAG